MKGWEIALLVVLCVGFVVAVGLTVYNKLKGKSGCDCCSERNKCSGCCPSCKSAQKSDGKESSVEREHE